MESHFRQRLGLECGHPMASRMATALAVSVVFLATAALVRSQQAVFRSGVQYVAVDVVVTDKSDKPVTDLKKDEFEIIENGKTQRIADFQFISVPAVTRTVETTITKAEPEPDVATNIAPKPDSRLFVMVIDDLHLIEQNIVEIKRVLLDTVNQFSPDDEVALVFVSHSNMGVNFTTNRGRILDTISRVRGAFGFGLDSLAHSIDGQATMDNARTARYAATGPSRFRLDYARSVAFTLENVAKSLAGSGHARRAIFFFSGGTTLEPFGGYSQPDLILQDDFKKVFDDARRADVPIYAIDPRGNVTPDDAVRGDAIVSEGIRSEVRRNLNIQHNNLAAIAVNTGGRAVFGAADTSRVVKEMIQENGSYYLLGYYPEPLVADGKFHDLTVKVSRPGTIVRARKGYVASSNERASASTASVLDTAMSSGVNVSGLPIRVFAAPIAAAAKGMTAAVTVEVAYPAPLDGSRRIDDSIELSLVALDPDAKVKVKATRPMKFSGAVPSSGVITFLIDDVIELPAQPLTLRVGVASQALGKAGTSQVAIDVPNVSDGKLHMSGVAIGFDGPAREGAMNGALIARLIPFQPTTTRVFGSGDTLRLFARMFYKGKGEPAVTVTVTREVPGPEGPRLQPESPGLQPKGPGLQVTPAVKVQAVDGGRMEAVFDTTLPLKSLVPGRYHLAVGARLPNGQAVSRDVRFEVK